MCLVRLATSVVEGQLVRFRSVIHPNSMYLSFLAGWRWDVVLRLEMGDVTVWGPSVRNGNTTYHVIHHLLNTSSKDLSESSS